MGVRALGGSDRRTVFALVATLLAKPAHCVVGLAVRYSKFHSHRQRRQPLVFLCYVLRGVRLDLRAHGKGHTEIGPAGIALNEVQPRRLIFSAIPAVRAGARNQGGSGERGLLESPREELLVEFHAGRGYHAADPAPPLKTHYCLGR